MNHIYRAFLFLLFAGLAAGCNRGPSRPEQLGHGPAPRVEVVGPMRKNIRLTVEQHAQVRAYEEAPLYAKFSGYVSKVSVDIGDRVAGPKLRSDGKEESPGQVLIELSIPEAVQQVEQKSALVAQAQSDIEQARAGVRLAEAAINSADAKVAESQAAIKRAASNRDRWQSENRRITELVARSAVTAKVGDESLDQFTAAQAALDEAEAKQKSAKAMVEESKASLQKATADLNAVQSHFRVAQSNLAEAKLMLDYATLRAPFDGIVTRRNVDTGHLVQATGPREPLLVIASTKTMRVFIDVPEASADLADVGDPVSIRIPALGEAITAGKITRTAGSLNPESRTLRVEVDVPNEKGQLRPGMYAYASIVLAEHHDALVVPATAVFAEQGQNYCASVEDGKLARKPVSLGLRSGDEVEIASGLSQGDKVIRANAAGFAPGQPVEPVPYAPVKP